MDIELARQVLDAQPFSRYIGARITEFSGDRAVVEIDVDDRLRQQFGFIHGGVLAYLADNSLTFAAGLALGPEVLTNGFTIDYLAAARDGAFLRATATVIRGGRRKASSRCEIEMIDADGTATLVAAAMGSALSTAKAPGKSAA